MGGANRLGLHWAVGILSVRQCILPVGDAVLWAKEAQEGSVRRVFPQRGRGNGGPLGQRKGVPRTGLQRGRGAVGCLGELLAGPPAAHRWTCQVSSRPVVMDVVQGIRLPFI